MVQKSVVRTSLHWVLLELSGMTGPAEQMCETELGLCCSDPWSNQTV